MGVVVVTLLSSQAPWVPEAGKVECMHFIFGGFTMDQEIILQIISMIIDALRVPHIAVLAGMLGIGVLLFRIQR